MLKTTAAYREAIKKNRIFHHEIEISFQDGIKDTVEDADLFVFQIEEGTSNTNSFDIGAAVAQQLTVKISDLDGRFNDRDFNGAMITARVGLELPDGSIEWLNKGNYIAEPGEDSGNTVTVKAFDNMVKFDREYSLSNLNYPATLGEIVRDACSCCEVILAPDSATFDNDDFIVQTRPDGSVTFRQVLQWAAQICCKYCKINTEGKLTLQWYPLDILESEWTKTEECLLVDIDGLPILDTNDEEIGTIIEVKATPEEVGIVDISDEKLLTGSTFQTDDVVITGVKVIEEDTSSDTVYQNGTEGYILEIEGNKLVQDGAGATVASYLGERLNGIQFRPLSLNVPGDPAREAGDLGFVMDTKRRYHKTIFTNVTYTAHTAQKLISGAEAPTRLSSVRYSLATRVYKELRSKIHRQKKEWDLAFDELQKAMDTKNGLFPIPQKIDDGSTILYFCDTPVLEEASIMVKLSAAGWGMSSDGGKTWNSGWLIDGTMIADILNAIGINAKWINTGALTVKDADGKTIFEVDIDKRTVFMDPDTLMLGKQTLQEKFSEIDNSIASSGNLTLQLDNEYQGIPAHNDGSIVGDFPSVTTTATALYNSTDVTDDCSFTVTASDSITGSWDKTTHTYTVKSLSAHSGWVSIRAVYLDTMVLTKKFTVAKLYAGDNGRTYYLDCPAAIVKRMADETMSPENLTFSGFYREGDSAGRTVYKGRFKIEETSDGKTWTTVYNSPVAGENSITWSMISSGSPKEISAVRCTLYALDGTTMIDYQTVEVVLDAEALTQEQVVNILTNNGAWKGLRYLNGHLYFSFDAARGGTLLLGGENNGNGTQKVFDKNGVLVSTQDVNGYILYNEDGLIEAIFDKDSIRLFSVPLDPNDPSADFKAIQLKGDSFSRISGTYTVQDGEIDIEIEEDPLTNGAFISFVEPDGSDWVRGGFDEINAGELNCGAGEATLNRLKIPGIATMSDTPDKSGVYLEFQKEIYCRGGIRTYKYPTVTSGYNCYINQNNYRLSKFSSSSERYKVLGDKLPKEFIDQLYGIEPIMAKYKDGYLDKSDERVGVEFPMFTVENIAEYFPLAVDHVDGKAENWNERIMIPAMFAMLKEQHQEIEELKKQLKGA